MDPVQPHHLPGQPGRPHHASARRSPAGPGERRHRKPRPRPPLLPRSRRRPRRGRAAAPAPPPAGARPCRRRPQPHDLSPHRPGPADPQGRRSRPSCSCSTRATPSRSSPATARSGTGGLNEEVIRRIQDRVADLRELADRKQTILKSIAVQGKLTDGADAGDPRGRHAQAARRPVPAVQAEEEVAGHRGPREGARAARRGDLEPRPGRRQPRRGAARAGRPREVAAEHRRRDGRGAAHPRRDGRRLGRRPRAAPAFIWDTGLIVANRIETLPEGKGQEYEPYFDFKEPVKEIPPHRVLAINRGEKANVLRVRIDIDRGDGQRDRRRTT